MTAPRTSVALPDQRDRRTAVQTFDRNLIVTAGAGTGKTTLLVDRLVHLLLRNPDPIKITEIVALTFTNKAANEMKARLRDRLQSYLQVDLQDAPVDDEHGRAVREVQALLTLYQLSKNDLDGRIQEAVRNLERADIGTIHSFAATLLRLYPLEAGMDPQFREDEGQQFDRIFDQRWDLWLDGELSRESSHAQKWRTVLKRIGLEEIKALARSLCSETVDIEAVPQVRGGQLAPVIRLWLEGLLAGAAELRSRHPEDRVNEKLIDASRVIIAQCLVNSGDSCEGVLSEEQRYLSTRSMDRTTKGWCESDVEKAQEIVRAAKGLCQVNTELTELLRGLLVPYVQNFRESFLREGFVSFDGLLMRARNLLRDHLRIREELKRHYRAILIDEFQDTDPVQYEILLYLAEQPGKLARQWRNVKLTPGKVFVVGDPKQSIYAFRRADIEAYLDIVEKIIKAQNGIECRLTTNFRSTAPIVDVINGVFSRLIQAQPGMQSPYIAIHPAPEKMLLPATDRYTRPALGPVVIRKIVTPAGEIDAEKARRLEGESLAAWLESDVLNRLEFFDANGDRVRAQPKDVAIIFRKLTDIHDYLEPLRRRGIGYIVEGERHFYAAKEIIDAVNLLRAVENSHDRLALVGVLRSPVGGMNDQIIYDLHCQNLLDYRDPQRLAGKPFPPSLRELYGKLAKLHDDCLTLPVGEAVTRIFSTLPLKLLAACYFHGEQAVANIEKLRRQAELLGREDASMTFKRAISLLQDRVLDIKEESESVLAEENVDAVRIMSIHKSKGLEFPIVVLAGCHSGIDGRRGVAAEALHDWSSGLSGIKVGPIRDIAAVYINEKNRLREQQEQKRVLYVAMTRAREHLIVSSGPNGRRESGSFVCMLDSALDGEIGRTAESAVLEIDRGRMVLDIVESSLAAPGLTKTKNKTAERKRNWRPYVESWRHRREAYSAALKVPVFVTPTLLKRQEQESSEAAVLPRGHMHTRSPAMLVGELAHRFLEHWDFDAGKEAFGPQFRSFAAKWLAPYSQKQSAGIRAELETILRRFIDSPVHTELAQARVLGRELPLLIPWDGQVMEGVIDLIYEKNGLLYLADYKTDAIEARDLHAGAQRYRGQAEIYTQAARQSLKREVAAFKLIFLRVGEAIEVGVNSDKELWLFEISP